MAFTALSHTIKKKQTIVVYLSLNYFKSAGLDIKLLLQRTSSSCGKMLDLSSSTVEYNSKMVRFNATCYVLHAGFLEPVQRTIGGGS